LVGIKNWLSNATAGYPGLLRLCVDLLCKKFRPTTAGLRPTDAQMLAFLGSREFLEKVFSQGRIFPEYLDPTTNDATRAMLRSDTDAAALREHAKFLTKCGYVAISANGEFELAAPLVRQFLVLRLFMPDSSFSIRPSPASLAESLEAALRRLDLKTLRETRSTNAAGTRIHESQWQEAFSIAYRLALPLNFFISPAFGHQEGLDAELDMLISGPDVCWGVELVCDGLRLPEHVSRFDAAGRYGDMVHGAGKIIHDWAVVDFRHSEPRELLDHVWYVIFAVDYRHATLRRKGLDNFSFELVSSNDAAAASDLSLKPPATPSRPVAK
jgi:hypothetical protein